MDIYVGCVWPDDQERCTWGVLNGALDPQAHLLSTGKDLTLNSYFVCGNYLNNRQRYFKYII